MGGFELPDGGGEGGGLLARRAGFAVAAGEDGGESLAAQSKARIVGEAVDQIVFAHAALAQSGNGGERVFLDRLVGSFPTDASLHRLHQNGGGHQEWQVVGGLRADHRRPGVHLAEDGEQGFKQPVDGEKRVRQHHPADHRAGDIALVPLVAGQPGGHCEMAFEDHVKAVDALAGARVHFVGHGAGAGLAGGETLAGGLVPGHQPQRFAKRRRAGREVHQRRHHPEIQRPRIDLADVFPHRRQPEVRHHAAFQLRNLSRVSTEQGKLVHLGAHRAFQAAPGVAREHGLQRGQAVAQFIAKHRHALAQGGRLGRHVVGAGGHHQVRPLLRALAHPAQRRHGFVADQVQRPPRLKLLDVLGEVARGEPLVNQFMAGQRVELLDARLHVVAGDAFPGHDRGEVHLILHALVGGDGGGGKVEAQFALGLHHGDPKLAFQHDPALGGPNGLHGGRGVAFGEYVGNHVAATLLTSRPLGKRRKSTAKGISEESSAETLATADFPEIKTPPRLQRSTFILPQPLSPRHPPSHRPSSIQY